MVSEKFLWAKDHIVIEPITSKTWTTTYYDETAASVLVQDGEEMIMHCQQNAKDNQSIQEYLEAFMRTPQGKAMPQQVRGDLEELGVI